MASNFFQELRRRNVYKVATVYAITAWIVTQVMSITSDAFEAPGWVMKTLIVILILGFPIAVILAWAYELSPEGIRRTTPDSENKKREKKKSLFKYWVIGLLVLAIILMGTERIFFAESTYFRNGDKPEQKASIAVLPFADFSSKGDQEYFADGISEEILNELAKVEGLQVAGRTSSFQFKNKNRNIKAIADSLGVDHILEGSVRKSGDQLRITAQLVRADTGFQIWTDTYDKSFSAENIFEIQDDISREVLEQLKVKLLASDEKPKVQKRTENTEAYNLFLKATSIESSYNPSDIQRAINLYDRAIELDPEFALAYARKAKAIAWLNYFGNLPFKEMIEKARNSADWALLLDPRLPDAYAAIGLIKWSENKLEQSIAAYDIAKKLAPGDAVIRAERAMPLLELGKMDEGLKELNYAYKFDPLSPLVNANLGWHYFYRQNYDEAEKYFKQAINIKPDFLPGYDGLISIMSVRGNLDQALTTGMNALTKVKQESPGNYFTLTNVALDLELEDVAGQYLELLKTRFPNNIFYFEAQVEKLMQEEKYEQVLTFTEDFSAKTEGLKRNEYLKAKVEALAAIEDYRQILQLLRENYPVALMPTELNPKKDDLTLVQYAALALLKTGKTKKAEQLLNLSCKFLAKQLSGEKTIDNEENQLNFVACSSLQGNKKVAKDYLQKRLEAQYLLNHHFVFGVFNKLFMQLSKQELKKYEEAEEKLLNEQRQNLMQILNKEALKWGFLLNPKNS